MKESKDFWKEKYNLLLNYAVDQHEDLLYYAGVSHKFDRELIKIEIDTEMDKKLPANIFENDI